jgi:hypothetical protein
MLHYNFKILKKSKKSRFKEKTKKIDFEEQYFNVIYKGVRLGLIKQNSIK